MTTKNEFDLLCDIAKLLSKYGPEAFEELAQSLLSPEITQRMAEVLQATANISRSVAVPEETIKTSNTRSIRKELDTIKTIEPEKHRILTEFYQALQEKRTLPTIVEISDFAANSGLPSIEVTRRPQAIAVLLRALIELPAEDVALHLKSVKNSKAHDRALQGWSDIILGNDRGMPSR